MYMAVGEVRGYVESRVVTEKGPNSALFRSFNRIFSNNDCAFCVLVLRFGVVLKFTQVVGRTYIHYGFSVHCHPWHANCCDGAGRFYGTTHHGPGNPIDAGVCFEVFEFVLFRFVAAFLAVMKAFVNYPIITPLM